VPSVLAQMMSDPDRARAKRASDAMMKMVKFDIPVSRPRPGLTVPPACGEKEDKYLKAHSSGTN
jgi:hypothetical protein